MGGSQSSPSFGEEFGFHHALQLAIDTASRSGVAVYPERLAATLIQDYPQAGMSEDEAVQEIIRAAEEARITIVRQSDG